jgi:hypothetical protein
LVDPSLDLTVFASREFAAAHRALTAQSRLDDPPWSTQHRALRVVVERTWLPRHARRVEVVHHAGGTAPPVGRPIVLTIHDLQYRAFPQFFHPVKRAFLDASVPRAVGRAAVITVPSEFVRADVHAAFAVPLDRIVVVPHMLPEQGNRRSAPTFARYALSERFVYPAVTWPHKNHSVLIKRSPVSTRGTATSGSCSARRGPATPPRRTRRSPGAHRACSPLGTGPGAPATRVYRAALALAFPSRYEGFGAPVIEAMAAGCPVIASATTALPEVVGDAGSLVDPDDASVWAAAITAMADDAALRRRLIDAGYQRVGRFTSSRSAELMIGAYRQALL